MALLSCCHFVYFPKSVILQSLVPEFIDWYFRVNFVNWGGESRVFHPSHFGFAWFLVNGNYHCQRSSRELVDRLEYQYHHKSMIISIFLAVSLLQSPFFLTHLVLSSGNKHRENSLCYKVSICDSTYRKVPFVGKLDFELWGCKVKFLKI